jgi:microcystin degradation protein MlrC
MKIFAAALGTETNTFSPVPTGMRSFEDALYFGPGEHPDEVTQVTAPIWLARRRAALGHLSLVQGTCAFALPGGITTRATYEFLRDRIVRELREALPVDAVVMCMHGAMVAAGYEDCEGDFLGAVRRLVGRDVVLAVGLDPHCHLSEAMVEAADLIVALKEYPHTDFVERAHQLLDLVERAVNAEIRLRSSVFDCRMITLIPTTREPARSFIDHIQSLEGEDGVLSISIAHGFPWADVHDLGTKVLVVTDADQRMGDALAEELGRALFDMRHDLNAPYLNIDSGLDKARAARDGPVVLADTSDNPGGGAPGDSTFVLQEILRRDVRNACLGPLYDPGAVRICHEAGSGARLCLRIGGKTGKTSGPPLDVEALVHRTVEKSAQSFAGTAFPVGDAASITVNGVDIVLVSVRAQALGIDLFTNLGVDPSQKKVVVVKSAQHFHAAYSGIAKKIIYLAGPGALDPDITRLEYRNIVRPLWPFDDDPFGTAR